MVVEVQELWDADHDSIDQTGLIRDETGTCKFTKWSKADLPELEAGGVYKLETVVTDEYQDRYSVSLNSASSLSEADVDLDV